MLEDNGDNDVTQLTNQLNQQAVIKYDEMQPEEDQTFEEQMIGQQVKKDKKTDALRSGFDFNSKGQLKDLLKQETPKENEKEKKLPDLERIPIIKNPLDWKARVPSQSLLLKNIEAAIDN